MSQSSGLGSFPGRGGYVLLFNVDMVDLLWGRGWEGVGGGERGRDRMPNLIIFIVWSAVVVSEWVVVA